MFERTLADLIRGLRASSKQDEAKFIALAVDEIRKEVRSKDMELKAAAILKLTYLDMLGYDMSWASFNVVEVMSSAKIHLKAVGYLAAVQSFKENTDVLMLTTNTLKKDLTSPFPADIATALDGLSHIVTPDLARDLSHDLIAMLNHSRPRIRKRAVLVMYKVIVKYPDVLPLSIGRLREKLDDSDPGVVSATVNVLCELARRDPQDYLPLAPQLFDILTRSSNNWMLIKVIKLFGALTPFEPRLVKKLLKPITEIISTTPAVSLLYECVHTCIIGGMLEGTAGFGLAKTCVSKLAAFLRDPDQNLKYIALLALVKIVPTHPHLVDAYQDEIMSSVDDQDISIRMRALDLISTMVTEHNLQSIVQRLLSHLVPDDSSLAPSSAEGSSAAHALARATIASQPRTSSATSASLTSAYRLEVARRVISMCARDGYENIIDFEWYLSVLVDLAYISNVAGIGEEIRSQLVDVCVRVQAVRRFGVKLMGRLLADTGLLENCREETSCSEVLWAAAWICGEYCTELDNPQEILELLLQPNISLLSPEILIIYLQSALKVFGHWAAQIASRWDEDFLPETKRQVDEILKSMSGFVGSSSVEVQERAANISQLFVIIQADLSKHVAGPVAAATPTPSAVQEDPSLQVLTSSSSSSSSSQLPTEPSFPKSLYLIRPLHVRELNAVALHAQKHVPIPGGLNLDAWIVTPSKLQASVFDGGFDGSEADTPDSSLKKSKKGKAKAVGDESKAKGKFLTKTKKKKEGQNGHGDSQFVETPEEAAAREVRRLERLAQQRDDPYYLKDNRASPSGDDNLDSIPIVKLDIPSSSSGPSPLPEAIRLPLSTHASYTSLRSAPSTPVPYVVDRGGEMPRGIPSTSNSNSNSASPTPSSSVARSASQRTLFPTVSDLSSASPRGTPSPLALSGGFPQYEVEDEETSKSVSTPEPIKVTKVKKKATGKKKKVKEVAAE